MTSFNVLTNGLRPFSATIWQQTCAAMPASTPHWGSRLTEMDQLNAGAARNARHRSDERSNCGSRRLLGQERLAAWALCADRLNPSQASVSATLIGRFSGLRPTAQPRLCCDVAGLGKALDR